MRTAISCYEGCDRACTDSGATHDTVCHNRKSEIHDGGDSGFQTACIVYVAQFVDKLTATFWLSNLRVLLSSPFKHPSSKTWLIIPMEIALPSSQQV